MRIQRFRLLPFFTVASFVAFVAVTIILAIFYRQTAIDDLITLRESNNQAVAQLFANALWADFQPLVATASELEPDALRAYPAVNGLDEAVAAQMAGLSVIKIKVYDLDGLTVYSTDPNQIGEDKSENPGFLAAQAGGTASELVYKDTFNAFEGIIEDRDIVESYTAIRRNGLDGPIAGVIEVYDDVTPLLQHIDQMQINIVVGVVITLVILYVVLLLIVNRADVILKRQRAEIIAQQEALYETNNELKAARELAEENTRLKSEFLSTMSHELRTPLNAIIGYSGIMLQGISGQIDAEAERMIQTMSDSSQHLLNLVNDILDLSKIEAGRMDIVEAEYAIRDLISSVETQMKILAKEKQLLFDIEIEDEVPYILKGDPERIKQILINLLSNAFKFTDKGAVGLYVSRKENQIWLRVRDTGIGIPPHALPFIFQEFRQVDGSSRREKQGTGLGLAIVRRLSQAMGGTVNVESKVGEGTVFTVALPLKTVVTYESVVA